MGTGIRGAFVAAPPARPAGAAPVRLLVVGEEHVRAKVARHYLLLREREGVEAQLYVDDRSGITREVTAQHPLPVHYAPNPRAALAYLRGFARVFARVRPQVLEVYTSVHPALLIAMMAYARARGVPSVVVCRGELYPPLFHGMRRHDRALLVAVLRMARLVVYKELYMEAMLERHAPRVPRFLWTNAVPVRADEPPARTGNHVLFLNWFHPERNLDVVVRAADRVRRAVPDVQFHLVGGVGERAGASGFYAALHRHEQALAALIAELGLERTVHIHPFTPRVDPHYARARVFLFPADHVFCNYALLEAMERGVPPVVSDQRDPDARRIVEDGVNGVVVPIDPDAVADAVVWLLGDEARRARMGQAARRTVIERFDLGRSAHALAEQYRRLAGAAGRPAAPAAAHTPAEG